MPRFLTEQVVCYEEPDGEVKQVGLIQEIGLSR